MNKIFIGKQVKHFAFPILVKVKSTTEASMVVDIFRDLGYRGGVVLNGDGYVLAKMTEYIDGFESTIEFLKDKYIDVPNATKYYFYLDQIDEELIRAIASVCLNKRWQPGEPFFEMIGGGIFNNYNELHIMGDKYQWCFKKVEKSYNIRRPEIYEICRHFGYYLFGKEIKKSRKVKQ